MHAQGNVPAPKDYQNEKFPQDVENNVFFFSFFFFWNEPTILINKKISLYTQAKPYVILFLSSQATLPSLW